MKNRLPVVVGLVATAVLALAADAPRIQVIPNDAARRMDVIIDGKPFTSYIYPTSQKKPVLFPLRTAKGTFVTRGWPLEPRGGERVDHPHHVGMWLNYGDVNGLDFWGHSEATPADQGAKMGTIVHRKVAAAKSGADRGDLAVEADWLAHDGHVVLRERTHFTFRGTPSRAASSESRR